MKKQHVLIQIKLLFVHVYNNKQYNKELWKGVNHFSVRAALPVDIWKHFSFHPPVWQLL